MNMDKEKIIEILEDYEFFVDDDFGGHYEHINCSQKALTPLGIVEILDYISELEQQVKKQQEVIDKAIELTNNFAFKILIDNRTMYIRLKDLEQGKDLLKLLGEVSDE